MDWIESHGALASHPKTRRLARELGVNVPTAIGHLHLLWWFTATYSLNGDLSRFEAGDIAEGALWDGDPTAFVAGLKVARFLDEDLKVHNWPRYTARYTQAQALSAAGNHRRWHEGPKGKPSADCPLCDPSILPEGSRDVSRDAPGMNGSSGSRDDPGTSHPDSADLTGPDLPDQTRPDLPDLDLETAPRSLASRPRDEVFETLATLDGIDPHHLNAAERGKLNRARRLATETAATPDQIRQAADNWVPVMGDATRTALGVMSNLQRLLNGPARSNARPPGAVEQSLAYAEQLRREGR